MNTILNTIGELPSKKSSWAILFLSALGLLLCALYFQYAMDLRPCVMCIYQRTAIIGILLSALIPLIQNNAITRLIAYIGWGVSAVWGLLVAWEHVGIQQETDPLKLSCPIFPEFPSFMPLHEWIPSIFGATGHCGSIDWEFLGQSMPQWMIVVFAIYALILLDILSSRLLVKKAL